MSFRRWFDWEFPPADWNPTATALSPSPHQSNEYIHSDYRNRRTPQSARDCQPPAEPSSSNILSYCPPPPPSSAPFHPWHSGIPGAHREKENKDSPCTSPPRDVRCAALCSEGRCSARSDGRSARPPPKCCPAL